VIGGTWANIAALFVDENDDPREALLEAILRLVEDDVPEVQRSSGSP